MTFKDAHKSISCTLSIGMHKYRMCAERALSAWRTCIRTFWAASRFSSCHMTPSCASNTDTIDICRYVHLFHSSSCCVTFSYFYPYLFIFNGHKLFHFQNLQAWTDFEITLCPLSSVCLSYLWFWLSTAVPWTSLPIRLSLFSFDFIWPKFLRTRFLPLSIFVSSLSLLQSSCNRNLASSPWAFRNSASPCIVHRCAQWHQGHLTSSVT